MNTVFPAEWAKQDAIVLAWPNKSTDWKHNLKQAQEVILQIIESVARYQKVILLVQQGFDKATVPLVNKNLIVMPCNYNDTWTRDYMPISVLHNSEAQLIDFGFNAWGAKFEFNQDNQVTRSLQKTGIFSSEPIDTNNFILEGGSIESNGKGLLLTTEKCLLNNNRNPHLTKSEIVAKLKATLGVTDVIWLKNGAIEGDDTDAHIDTLVRFIDEQTLVYAKGPTHELLLMEAELKNIATKYSLTTIAIEQPQIITNHEQEVLPATYVNFLITNKEILVPIYNVPQDEKALKTLQKLSPNRKVVGVDCNALIQQNGSLHCITMQLLAGTLKTNL